MKIRNEFTNRVADIEFWQEFAWTVGSAGALVYVQTYSIERTLAMLRKAAAIESYRFACYDPIDAFRTGAALSDRSGYALAKAPDSAFGAGHEVADVVGALGCIYRRFRKEIKDLEGIRDTASPQYRELTNHMVIAVSPMSPRLWENDRVKALLHRISTECAEGYFCVVMVGTGSIPDEYSEIVHTVRVHSPGYTELRAQLVDMLNSGGVLHSLSDDDISQVVYAGAGMSIDLFGFAVAKAVTMPQRDADDPMSVNDILDCIRNVKISAVNKNSLLQLEKPTPVSNVGGLDALKAYVTQRRDCFGEEAFEMGIQPPKGIVLVGPPGTGKTLSAKAVAASLGIPMVRLDFGRIFNHYQGKSEEQMREALRMVEAMAPVVLMVDEIEKAFGGVHSDGSDTSLRVFSTYLVWLQECEAPVYSVVTANKIDRLPPELTRRGRFDAIFATKLPGPLARLDVLRIHLKTRGWDPDSMIDAKNPSYLDFVTASKGYVPAEIENAVNDGLIDAFSAEEDFTLDHVIDALKATRPVSQVYASQIEEMAVWAEKNAKPADNDQDTDANFMAKHMEKTNIDSRPVRVVRQLRRPDKD